MGNSYLISRDYAVDKYLLFAVTSTSHGFNPYRTIGASLPGHFELTAACIVLNAFTQYVTVGTVKQGACPSIGGPNMSINLSEASYDNAANMLEVTAATSFKSSPD